MRENDDFVASLIKYGWKKLTKLPISPWYLGVGIVIMVMAVSALNMKYSIAFVQSRRQAIEKAARAGDYPAARRLLEKDSKSSVLGADSELEELVYPERKVEREIARYEELNGKYPGSRDILVALSKLYKQLGNEEKAKERWEEAKKLDPNNEIFREK